MIQKTFAYLTLIAGLVLLASTGCTPSSSYKTVSAEEFRTVLKEEGMQLLDVRSQEEFDAGHIDCAVQINVNDEDFETKVLEHFDPNRPIAVYCRRGTRSAKASELLSKAGFKVINLEGGYEAFNK